MKHLKETSKRPQALGVAPVSAPTLTWRELTHVSLTSCENLLSILLVLVKQKEEFRDAVSTGHVSQVRFWVRPVDGQTQGLDYDQLLGSVILDYIGSDRKLFTTLKSALSSSILPAPSLHSQAESQSQGKIPADSVLLLLEYTLCT